MRKIIHITADYPDNIVPAKTAAVKKLIELTTSYEHKIYSLNRKNGLGGIQSGQETAPELTSLTYKAPPLGILLESFLNPVADWIYNDIRKNNIQVDIIHAHKMTVDGVIARRIAEKLDRPFICSIWGNTDQKIIRMKPTKAGLFRKVALQSEKLLPAAPWTQKYVTAKLGIPPEKFSNLPVITDTDELFASTPSGLGIVTLFNLDFYKKKGLPNLLKAISVISKKRPNIQLVIMGGGRSETILEIEKLITGLNLEKRVKLTGPVKHEDVQKHLNNYSAFILPTLTETYGMVFVEALFSGLPVLYTEGRGIDGYFDNVEIAYRCNPTSVNDIVRGIDYLLTNEIKLKQNIRDLQENGFFQKFRKHEIAKNYTNILNDIDV